MVTSYFLAIELIIAAIIAVVLYFIAKNNGKSSRISSLLKSHPVLAKVLLDCEKVPPISMITDEQTAKVLSLSDSDWEEWEFLCKRVRSLAEKYPHTLYDQYLVKFYSNVSYSSI